MKARHAVVVPAPTRALKFTPAAPMTRFHQALLILSTLAVSWLGMQIVHELGHVLGAAFTGGTVRKVVLHPLVISRTDVGPNPAPLFVCWAGPVVGSILPCMAWGLAALLAMPGAYVARFFAGFCLIANGFYIGLGSFPAVGDAGDLLALGSPLWLLWLFGVAAAVPGFLLWHGLGPRFGLAGTQGRVEPLAAYVVFAVLAATVAAELMWGRRG